MQAQDEIVAVHTQRYEPGKVKSGFQEVPSPGVEAEPAEKDAVSENQHQKSSTSQEQSLKRGAAVYYRQFVIDEVIEKVN